MPKKTKKYLVTTESHEITRIRVLGTMDNFATCPVCGEYGPAADVAAGAANVHDKFGEQVLPVNEPSKHSAQNGLVDSRNPALLNERREQ